MRRCITSQKAYLGKGIISRNCSYAHPKKTINVEALTLNSTQQEIADAFRPHFEQSPVLLKGANVDCDAIESWKSFDYLQTTVGEDTPCFVEIGTYANPDVERPEITFGDYIQYMRMFQEQYGDGRGETTASDDETDFNGPNSEELVYLAQNDLFPPLRNDFQIPEFCRDSSFNIGHGQLYSTMFWFGPRYENFNTPLFE